MVIQSKDWTLKNTHSKGGMKLSKTHEIGFKDCRVGILLWLRQVCPDFCTCSLLIRVRHYGWERPWGQLCHVLLGERDGVGPRVVIRQQDQEEEVCELWLQYWEERLLQPHVLCPLPSRKSGSTWREGVPVELAWLPSQKRFFGVCPLTNWLPGLMVIFVMGATFPCELGGEGKTPHINNLMHPW